MNPNSTLVTLPESQCLRAGKSWLMTGQICAALLLACASGCDKLPFPKADSPAPQQQAAPKATAQPQPPVVQQPSPPLKVEPTAPIARSGDEILDDLKKLQGNRFMSGITDETLAEAAAMDEQHRALVTSINAIRASKVTVKGLQSLQSFPNLKTMEVIQMPFGHNPAMLSELGKLTSLETLTLQQSNLLDEDMQYLKPLQNLKVLVIEGNSGITDQAFVHLKHLLALEHIDVSFCSINGSGFRQFRDPKLKHPGLKSIVAHHTNFGLQGLEAIHQWKTIEAVNCAQSLVNDNTLFGLNGLINLKTVSLGYDSFSIVGLTKANFKAKKKLESVYIDNVAAVNDACLDLFKFNKSLKTIRLKSTGATQAGADRLKKMLKTDVEIVIAK